MPKVAYPCGSTAGRGRRDWRRSCVLRERRSEEVFETRQPDEEQNAQHEHRRGEGRHQQRLAVELLRILHGALGLEGGLEIDRHRERDEREAEDQFHAVADDEGAEEEHGRRRIEEHGDEQRLRRVALEGCAVGAGDGMVAGLVQLVEFGEALERHEVAADHPVGNQQRDGRNDEARYRVPSQQHAQRIVDGLREHVEVGNVLRAHGRKVIETAHDPEHERGEREHARDVQADGDARDHHQKPLNVGHRNVDEAARRGSVALDGMQAVVGRVQNLVDDVVAARNQRDGDEGQEELRQQMPGTQAGIDAERDDNAGQDKKILDGVVEPDDGEMRAEALGEGDPSALGSWHQ